MTRFQAEALTKINKEEWKSKPPADPRDIRYGGTIKRYNDKGDVMTIEGDGSIYINGQRTDQ